MRLIDADALMREIVSVESEVAKRTPYEEHLFRVMAERQHEILDTITNAPTIDAVEVVRCKECIHYESDGGAMMVCNVTDMVCDNDDYCSYGERREESEVEEWNEKKQLI